jgi:hypothetical protein
MTYVIVGEAIPHRSQQLTKTIFVNEASVVLVEASERVLDDLLRVGSLETLAEQREEHGEVDRTGSFVHHLFQILVRRVLAYKKYERVTFRILKMFVQATSHKDGRINKTQASKCNVRL